MERTAGWCSQEPNKEELLWNELPDGAVRNPIRRNHYGTNCRMVQSGTQLGGIIIERAAGWCSHKPRRKSFCDYGLRTID